MLAGHFLCVPTNLVTGPALHFVRRNHGPDLHVAAVRRQADVPHDARVQEGVQ